MSRKPSRRPSPFRIRWSMPPRDAWLTDGVTDIVVGVAVVMFILTLMTLIF